MSSGYYCVIQYVPDRNRMEAANIGVLLYRPEPHCIKVMVAPTNARIKKLFDKTSLDDERYNIIRNGICYGVMQNCIRSLEDLNHFIDTMGNYIMYTRPRSMLIEHMEKDINRLYKELVL